MSCLRVRLLGDCRISLAGEQLPAIATHEARQLFAYLLVHWNRHFTREALGSIFFADSSDATALKRLRTAIWRIRSVIEPDDVDPGTFLTVTNREIGFNEQSDYWLDVEQFEREVAGVAPGSSSSFEAESADRLLRALELYRGDLLEGSDEEWCLWEKERLKLQYLRCVEMLMAHHAAHADWESAILYGQQLLSHDPLREHVHRSLIRYYYLLGDRPAALIQYDGCAQLLRDELGIEPMRETNSLYRAIKEECALAALVEEQEEARETMLAAEPPAQRDGLADLHDSALELDKAARHLRLGIARVEELFGKRC